MPPAEPKFSVLDLVDLPAIEREVWLALSRTGPVATDALSEELHRDASEVQDALVALHRKGWLRLASGGQWQVLMGHIGRHTTLPVAVWPALLGTDRIYTEQDIATLQSAIPMLQFGRARLSQFNDHGPNHGLRVKAFATQLSYVLGLVDVERHLLRAAALLHDIGNIVDRAQHNVISQQTVEKLVGDGQLPFSEQEGHLVGLLCRWHRGEYDPMRTDTLRGEPIRTGLMAAILRLADAMDIDQRRADYRGRFRQVLEFFFPESMPHWTSLEQIIGVRLHCGPPVALQVFTRGPAAGNLQIDRLREKLGSTPFDWIVREIDLTLPRCTAPVSAAEPVGKPDGQALVVFPFEAHSLVMSALSRRHLVEAGYRVDLLCYPDTAGGPAWLYHKVLPKISAGRYERILLLGDRPDDTITPDLLSMVHNWRKNGVVASILNRHEANWSRLPGFLALGAEVILGGDWAYFWGQAACEADLRWARIGALCTRDPTQSTVGMTAREREVTEGLLSALYSALAEPPADNTADWLAAAEPILDRIAADDQAYFARMAGGFRELCARLTSSGRVEGQVVVFDGLPGWVPQAYYWVLEAAIEGCGRVPERGLRFNVPYAMVHWPSHDATELLAINHWREEEAIPVRLLYPSEVGPQPHGDESTVRVRMSAEQAAAVIPALTAACNKRECQ